MGIDRIWTLMSRKLTGEATETEVAELDELIKIHPDTAIPLQLVDDFWVTPAENDEDFLEATYHLHTGRLKEKGLDLEINKTETGLLNINVPASGKKRKIVFISALVTLALVILFFSFSGSKKSAAIENKSAQSEISTKNGSRTKIQLPDGSSVWLNSSSKLVYDNKNFGAAIREVTLTGEAYFDVVKNSSKPFIIHTSKMDIKVLGTAFNVKCYPGEKNSETSLIHGSIEVTLKDRQEKIFMKPNEKLILCNDDVKPLKINAVPQRQPAVKSAPIIQLIDHLTIFPKDNSVVETAWVDSRLVFNEETLEDIAVKMERWYGISIVITNEKLKKIHLTGSFERETIYQALNALQLTTPFTYKIDMDIITISK